MHYTSCWRVWIARPFVLYHSFQKVIEQVNTRCKMIVVARWWPMMYWVWDLVNQSTTPPLQLLHWSQKQPFSQKYHQNLLFLLRKIALPYPHKCLFGFVEQKRIDRQEFLRNILVTRGDPFVCACPRLRSSRCRQTNVESSSLYFWSIWEQHVLFLIIVHSRMKIYEVLKRASVHLPVVVHYSTGTTTILPPLS